MLQVHDTRQSWLDQCIIMLGHMNSTLVAKERRDASLNRGSDLLLDLWRHDTLADLRKKVVLRGELLAVRSLPLNNLLNLSLIHI